MEAGHVGCYGNQTRVFWGSMQNGLQKCGRGHIAFWNKNSMDILETDISMVAVWPCALIWINTDLLSTELQTSIKFEMTCIIILIQENTFKIIYFRPHHKQKLYHHPCQCSMKLNRERVLTLDVLNCSKINTYMLWHSSTLAWHR